jgi:hypothetical protein
VEFEYELRNNAKVASSSSNAPEKIGIFSLTRGQNRSISGDDSNLVEISARYDMIWQTIYLDKVIDSESMLTAQMTDASSKS